MFVRAMLSKPGRWNSARHRREILTDGDNPGSPLLVLTIVLVYEGHHYGLVRSSVSGRFSSV